MTAASSYRPSTEHLATTTRFADSLDWTRNGDFTIQERELVSTLSASRGRSLIILRPSFYLGRTQCFTSIPAHTADLDHTEITFQVIPKLKYVLRLLVDNDERELQRINNRTWEPAKPLYASCLFDMCTCSGLCICRDVSPASQMRVEIQVQSSHLHWWKKDQGTTVIDCQAIFKDYCSTTAHEFPVPGQLESPTSPFIADGEDVANIVAGKHSYPLELQFSAEVTVRLLIIAHHRLLILFV